MTELWIWLAGRPGLGPVKLRALLERFGSPKALYEADSEALAREGLTPRAQSALADKDLRPAQAILHRCRLQGIDLLCLSDAAYPSALRQTPDAPPVLYCLGRLPVSGQQPWIGLVGARQADSRGLRLAYEMSPSPSPVWSRYSFRR